ncbi:protein-glutamate O-methyltransferase CheR [Gallaecimonas kandeliae]|uniref:CheR family methyltransferase n=1 Tax=Gallaecimonas kandeliae TaxID=3029055 RepID=UPI002647AAC6|nr:protein-glutamate O-methyltransferase CheR [Gallaecimonas kandeliae]WKE67058.1 protein-glutamate O-methyltransferase CheR [Gallaecimonas kandeliae]
MGVLLNPPEGFAFTAADFAFIRQRIFALAGIRLLDHKDKLVYSRLSRRIRELGLHSFAQYCQLLERQPAEQTHFVNALTTNKTQFFREQHHFAFLAELAERHPAPLRLWSAACSTGEEPYSIAAQLVALGRHQDKVLATDLNTQVLAAAEAGLYDLGDAAAIPQAIRHSGFLKGKGAQAGWMKPRQAVRALVSFRRLNLMDDWPFREPFDVIFCRNVMIYFDKATQSKLLGRFRQHLRAGGYLLLGHAEGMDKGQPGYRSLGHTIWEAV